MRWSSHVSHISYSQVKSCESARVSAETVSGGSVVAVGMGGKDGIVIKKVGYAQRCRGLNYVRIVSPQFDSREGVLPSFRDQRIDRVRRVGVARRRCALRSCERLGGLLV